jgi:hypothetical protein
MLPWVIYENDINKLTKLSKSNVAVYLSYNTV